MKESAVQSFGEVHAINDMIFRSLDVQHAEDCRIQIIRLNAHFTTRAGLGDAGPNHHGRNTNAAFVNAAFAAP